MNSYSNKNEDFKNTHFDYPELSRIVGEPTLGALLTLRNQIKANAQTVETTLGGGAHGHLGLVVSAIVYEAIDGTVPYERPQLPVLDIQPTDTQYQIAQQRHQYSEDLQQYRDVQAMERTIIQQIVAAIEPKYLRALRDRGTNRINKTIPQILKYLFDTFGDITPKEFKQLRDQVESMIFDPSEPVDTIFAEIEDLENIADMAENPMRERQKIDMAYLVLQNSKKFNSSLTKWDRREDDKTWDDFMTFFRKEQRNMRRTGELTMSETLNKDDFVNLLTEGIKEGVECALATKENDIESRNDDNTTESNNSLATRLEQMNATIAQLKQEKQDLQSSMSNNMGMGVHPMMMYNPMLWQMQMQQALQNNNNNNHRGQNGNSNNNKPRRQRNPGKRFKFYNRYCWSCGGCDHWGRNCHSKKDGHVDLATFKNKQGGSTDNCFTH